MTEPTPPPGPDAAIDPWLTTAEAAALAGVRPDTLRHYARSGHAPTPRQFGRALMWHKPTVLAWLAERPGRGARTDLRRAGTESPSGGPHHRKDR